MLRAFISYFFVRSLISVLAILFLMLRHLGQFGKKGFEPNTPWFVPPNATQAPIKGRVVSKPQTIVSGYPTKSDTGEWHMP